MAHPTRIDFEPWQILHLCGGPAAFNIAKDITTSRLKLLEQLNAMEAFYKALVDQLSIHDPAFLAQASVTYNLLEQGKWECPEYARDMQLISIELHAEAFREAFEALKKDNPDGTTQIN